MKRTKIIATLAISALILVVSCSVGVKKDLLSGLTVKYNGFTVGNSYLVKDSKKTTDVKIQPGKVISLVFSDIGGFAELEGKAYPGASILVTDSKGKIVLDVADLFSSYDSTGVDVALVKQALSIDFTAPASGFEKGETFSWKSKVWDKKGKATLDCELQLELE